MSLEMTDLEVVKRVVLSTALAGVIGFERERHGRAAGFRTHILVSVGSCLVMLTGLYLMETLAGGAAVDPTRMASQVVSGIGFLGAGTILQFRASVRGLTTAASLWAVAGIGLAVGAGFFSGAVATTVAVIVALFALSSLERAMRREWYQVLVVEAGASAETLTKIRQVLSEYDVEIQDFDVTPGQQPSTSRLQLRVKLLSHRYQGDILQDLKRLEQITDAHWS